MSVFTNGARAQALRSGHLHEGTPRRRRLSTSPTGIRSPSPHPQGAFGVKIESPASYGKIDWLVDHVWAYGFATNFAPPLRGGHYADTAERDPGFGPCRLWCPDGAACKGAASDGSDLGATILYRYENGKLTGNPLWDRETGAFLGAGAIVAGLNDVPGSSLFDVPKRLNVNQNGCRFPSGYASGAASKPETEKRPTPETGAGRPDPQ